MCTRSPLIATNGSRRDRQQPVSPRAHARAHPASGEDVPTEWETVQGIRFPRRWTVFRSGVRVVEAKEARSFVNSGLKPADLAAKPPDLKPALSWR